MVLLALGPERRAEQGQDLGSSEVPAGCGGSGAAGALEPWSDALPLFQLQPEQLDCGAAHLQHPLSALRPLRASPVFRAPGLSAVAVAAVGSYTVVFLGTVSGRLLKVRPGRGCLAGAGRGPTG